MNSKAYTRLESTSFFYPKFPQPRCHLRAACSSRSALLSDITRNRTVRPHTDTEGQCECPLRSAAARVGISETTAENSLETRFSLPCYRPWERKYFETTTGRSSALPKPENAAGEVLKCRRRPRRCSAVPRVSTSGNAPRLPPDAGLPRRHVPGGELQPLPAPDERSGPRGVWS